MAKTKKYLVTDHDYYQRDRITVWYYYVLTTKTLKEYKAKFLAFEEKYPYVSIRFRMDDDSTAAYLSAKQIFDRLDAAKEIDDASIQTLKTFTGDVFLENGTDHLDYLLKGLRAAKSYCKKE